MVYLKDFLYSISFPIRYWIERYKDWKEERKYQFILLLNHLYDSIEQLDDNLPWN